ncbi:pitrilysin family protein [soil metagenome]
MQHAPEILVLSNGLRVLYHYQPETAVTHCALMMKAGTRDESKGQEGMAHFIEHCLFKGTTKRKSFHILNRLEVVGGELNAYTTKEETCIHASVMNAYLERSMELIADIVFHSIFPDKEIEKEKDVIVDEIRSYQDTPYEQIFDDFESIIFGKHALGHPILGTETSLRKFKRKDLLTFLLKYYHPSRMVLSISTAHTKDKVVKIAQKYFNEKTGQKKNLPRKIFSEYAAQHSVDIRSVSQVHHITGVPGYSVFDKDRYSLVLMNNLLGGPGMNSRLNLNIREKYGFTYTIESGYHAYTDTGIFHIYFATDIRHYEKTLQLLEQEIDKLCTQPITPTMFRQYQEQLLGQITMGQENRLNVLLSMSKGLLNFDRVKPLSEIMAKIRALTPEQIRFTARKLLVKKNRSSLVYQPK